MAFRPSPVTAAERRAQQAHAGLCAQCAHLQLVHSKTSTFVRCGLSDRDEGFLRYPPLPVRLCPGFVPDQTAAGEPREPAFSLAEDAPR